MTNREYLEQKKEAFYQKLSNIFERYITFIYVGCLVIDIVLFFAVCKVSVGFLALFIPCTIFNVGFTLAMFEIWLDKEHKESK